MSNKQLNLIVDKKLYEDIHQLMLFELQSDNGMVTHRMFEGKSKQEWYRTLLREGLKSKLIEWSKKEKQLQESQNEI